MPESILVVDDEVDVQDLIRQKFRHAIRQQQYHFIFALNGVEALEQLQQHPEVTVMFTDLNMPLMDGLTLLKQTRQAYPHLYTIVVSAYGDMGNIRQAMNAGAFDFLTKPMSLEDLQATLRRAVEQVQLDRQKQQKFQQLQTQLIQGEKMSALGQLIAGIAHEVNNPVNFISGNMQFAQSYTEDLIELIQTFIDYHGEELPESLKEKLEEIDFEFLQEDLHKLLRSMTIGATRIQEIVLSLRNFSRTDLSQRQPFNLLQGLEDTLMILNHRLKAKFNRPAIQVIKHYEEIPEVAGYGSQINQVFMNLLGNAIDALEEQSQHWTFEQHEQSPLCLTLTVAPLPTPPATPAHATAALPWIQVKITDNGPGIPLDCQEKLFQPFFTTKPVGQGTGLGLSISYQIVVDGHQGTLRCQSEPGQGTTFIVELPVFAAEEASPAQPPAQPPTPPASDLDPQGITLAPPRLLPPPLPQPPRLSQTQPFPYAEAESSRSALLVSPRSPALSSLMVPCPPSSSVP